MPTTELTEITDPKLQERVRTRYQQEIEALQAIGFLTLTYCHEALGRYSAISQFPLVFFMWPKKEIITVSRSLRLGVANVLLVHSHPPSIAECMGMGVKFYSAFSDGCILVSPSFQSQAIPRLDSPILKNPPGPTLEESWSAHVQRAKELQNLGKNLLNTKSFADYLKISKLENDDSQYLWPATPND